MQKRRKFYVWVAFSEIFQQIFFWQKFSYYSKNFFKNHKKISVYLSSYSPRGDKFSMFYLVLMQNTILFRNILLKKKIFTSKLNQFFWNSWADILLVQSGWKYWEKYLKRNSKCVQVSFYKIFLRSERHKRKKKQPIWDWITCTSLFSFISHILIREATSVRKLQLIERDISKFFEKVATHIIVN